MFDDDRLNDKYSMLRDFAAKLAPPAREIVGRESEKISLMSSLARPEMCNVILLAPPGTGKAHPNDELIPVADERGYVRVGLLKVGDRVFDEHGEPVTVTGVFPQGIKREYVVVTNAGDRVRCNDEHLWTVRSVGDAEGVQQTMSLREIMDAGLADSDGAPIWQLPASGALVRQSRILPVDPYVCGALLGWGVRIDDRGYVTVPHEMPDEVFAAIEDHMGWERVYGSGDSGERSTFINRATGKRLTPDEVMTHPVMTSVIVKPENQRHIPYTYITSSVKDRESVLRALRDSESYRLSQGAAWVIDADMRELERSLDATGDMIVEVIDTDREVEMTCIMVDSETHLYQVGRGHVVTHNTVLVQSCMQDDQDRIYLEVDMAKMIADLSNPEEMAARLKALFDEAESFSRSEGREIVLFIDEFHQVVQLSAAAVEALKPLLAASGSRGIKVIAATTYDEFNAHIASNLPLVERLARINIPQTDREVTIAILKGMAKKYDVDEGIFDDSLYEQIFEYTNRYVPASVQPRKSIRVLDAMVGRHRYLGERMDKALLATVLKIEFGVEVEIDVNAAEIKAELDKRVFSQDFATTSIARRLQLCVAGLNDQSKPMSSLLFTGATGTGKGTLVNERIPVFTEDGSVSWKRAGDLVPGDKVFDQYGQPETILGVFPQPVQDVYRVHLSDGRSLVTDGPHLWGVYPTKRDRELGMVVMSTQTLMQRLAQRETQVRGKTRFSVPMNRAVQWPERELSVDPYAVGVMIADGCLSPTVKALTISSNDEFVIAKFAQRIGSADYRSVLTHKDRKNGGNYSWVFPTGEKIGNKDRLVQKASLISSFEGLMDRYSKERFIPDEYMVASVEQRWDLVQGLFDCDGTIQSKDGGRYNVSYSTSSEKLAYQVQELLLSLGVVSTVTYADRDNGQGSVSREFTVHVRSANADKHRFFGLPRKLEIAGRAAFSPRKHVWDYDYVDIVRVEKLDRQEATVCIYVDHPEHLYQAGDFIVTHNTEVTKQLSKILFGDDQRHLIRFDMTEWGRDDSVDLFREELSRQVWATSHCVLLFDEIEKASPLVVRLLLQVLDDGRLSDKDGRQVSFLNTYIVLTTNAGSEIYRTIGEYNADDHGSEASMREYEKVIEESIKSTDGGKFPPELLGRIDAIVPFQPLSRPTLRKIMMKKLSALKADVKRKHGIDLTIDKRVVDFLVEDESRSDSDAGGARDMVRRMQRYLSTEVAAFINEHPEERVIAAKIDGTLRSEDVTILKSDARVVVLPYDKPRA